MQYKTFEHWKKHRSIFVLHSSSMSFSTAVDLGYVLNISNGDSDLSSAFNVFMVIKHISMSLDVFMFGY